MNLLEISNKFPTELDCIKYFEAIRFGKQVYCPYCKTMDLGNRTKEGRWHCSKCNCTFSVTTETKLHDTKLPLKKWLFAFSVISDAKKGISAKQLERNIGVHYETAWTIYHKIRDLMSIENDGITLNDIVEFDTTTIDKDMRKCQAESKGTPASIPELDREKEKYETEGFKFKEGKYKKPCKVGKQKTGGSASDLIISGAVERYGNVVAQVIKDTSFSELRKLIDRQVIKNRKETVLITDETKSNLKFRNIMNQIVIEHKKLYSYKGLNSNSIESFWAIVERQIKGQHHHVSLEYLSKYVAETVFKFNNRKRDDMFETLVKFSMLNK